MRFLLIRLVKPGMAIAAKIPNMTMMTMSSIRVKPSLCFKRDIIFRLDFLLEVIMALALALVPLGMMVGAERTTVGLVALDALILTGLKAGRLPQSTLAIDYNLQRYGL